MPRVIIFPCDDTDDSERSFEWMLLNFFKDDDEVHLIHVIARMAYATTYAVPAIDFTPGIDRDKYEANIRKAETFIVKRFLSRFPPESKSTPIVHVVKSETDSSSVGHIICGKAYELRASSIVMGSHNKGAVKGFFMGSVSKYILTHCVACPVVIVKNI